MWMPLLFLAFFFSLCFQCKLYPVTSQLIISIRHLDAHCLISFLHSGKDGRARPGERVECPHTRFAGQKNNLYNGKG